MQWAWSSLIAPDFSAAVGIADRRPKIEPLHKDCDDDPINKDERKRAAHGLERTPQEQSPLAA